MILSFSYNCKAVLFQFVWTDASSWAHGLQATKVFVEFSLKLMLLSFLFSMLARHQEPSEVMLGRDLQMSQELCRRVVQVFFILLKV